MSDLNEAKRTIKRSYRGGEYPAIRVYDSGKVRNRIIDFVGTKVVTDEDLQAYIDNIVQEEEGAKKSNYRKWFKRNGKYFKTTVKEGKKTWCLSKLGKRVYELTCKKEEKGMINEDKCLSFDDFLVMEDYVKEARILGRGMSDAALAADTEQSDQEYIASKQYSKNVRNALLKLGAPESLNVISRWTTVNLYVDSQEEAAILEKILSDLKLKSNNRGKVKMMGTALTGGKPFRWIVEVNQKEISKTLKVKHPNL